MPNKVNLIVIVEEGFTGERIREVKVADAGMDVIMYWPKAGVIIGTCQEYKTADFRHLEGVREALTDDELGHYLRYSCEAQPAKAAEEHPESQAELDPS